MRPLPSAAPAVEHVVPSSRRSRRARPVFRAKAPLRLSFAGGGTDVAPFPEREGGLVLSATISRYAYGFLRPRADRHIRVESLDLGTAIGYSADDPVSLDGRLALVQAAIGGVADLAPARGFDLVLKTAVPPGSGLGASSALIVTLIGLLANFHRLELSPHEIARLAWETERVRLGLRGGSQDHYAAALGGFNFMEFEGDEVTVNPLRINLSTLFELESNLLLAFTGSTRASDHIIEDQTDRYVRGEAATRRGLRNQKALAVAMKDALVDGRLSDFGELLGSAWEEKKRLSPRISTAAIDEAYEEARQHGALGGKVTGAGGGGYMLFYCQPGTQHRVGEALGRLGLECTEISFTGDGVHSWSFVEGDRWHAVGSSAGAEPD